MMSSPSSKSCLSYAALRITSAATTVRSLRPPLFENGWHGSKFKRFSSPRAVPGRTATRPLQVTAISCE